jgi:hypothetical protein
MLIQVIIGKVKDAELVRQQGEKWQADLKPGAKGYLGATTGVTPDGHSVALVRFDSEESAQANSNRPEQAAWWGEMSKAFDGDPSFVNCTDIDEIFGGGSNDAGFVQVMQGQAKDQEQMRSTTRQMEAELKKGRPDILGIVVAWHGDAGKFTQAIYFRSEEEARQAEKAGENDEMTQQYMDLFAGPPTFYDLPDPVLD